MDIVSAILSLGLSPLVIFAVAVFGDDVLGVAVGIKTKTFSLNKLPSFLASQFGTKEFLVVAAAALAAYETGGDAKAAATAIVVTGGFALTASVLRDAFGKAQAFLAKAPAAPAAPVVPAAPAAK